MYSGSHLFMDLCTRTVKSKENFKDRKKGRLKTGTICNETVKR